MNWKALSKPCIKLTIWNATKGQLIRFTLLDNLPTWWPSGYSALKNTLQDENKHTSMLLIAVQIICIYDSFQGIISAINKVQIFKENSSA